MKAKKSGFSLVELICTLTIAAILAVAAAPNVTAYIQNSKMQNYQTALNNLVGELQTKLPQTRYWNWQEVKDNAAEILGSDVARNVSEPEIDGTKCTYTLSNVSTDSDVQFKLSIDYGTPNLTKQDITISGECVGFDSVKSEGNTCTVLLKSNFVDKDNYPVILQEIQQHEINGWKGLENRVKTYSEWDTWLNDPDNNKNDFRFDATFPEQYKNSNTDVINVTDYACNSVQFVQFKMSLFSYISDGTGKYAFPSVDVNDGLGTGAQYDASKANPYFTDNIYIYIGDDNDTNSLRYVKFDDYGNEVYDDVSMSEHGWVKYDVIFKDANGNFQDYDDTNSKEAKAIEAFKNKYSSEISIAEDGSLYNNSKVTYRVLLRKEGCTSSRGWIVVKGINLLDVNTAVHPERDSVTVYVDNGDIPDDMSKILYNQKTESTWHPEKTPERTLYKQTLFLDFNKCGYQTGDELTITLKNVDANFIEKYINDPSYNWLYPLGSNVDRNNNDALQKYFNPKYTTKKLDNNTFQYIIDLDWNLYPFVYITFCGSLGEVGADISIGIEQNSNSTTTTTTSSNIPAVTVNGNDKYALLTFDWSKCDYITERNIGNMHLEFSQPLNYIVYSRDYTPLNYYTIYSKQYFYPIQIADSALKTSILDSEKLVHLYFDGISADEIKYQIKNCPSAPGTGEAPAPGAPDAPGTPIIPDAPAKPAPVEPDEPEEEVEEQSLTIHYIYAGKQYSKVYYDSFGSLNGQPSNVVTYTRNTDHNITFKKTDAILYFYPALGENDSPNSSDWMNISYDYIKTHNIHDLYIKGGIVYISNPDPNYVEYEVTLKREPLKSMCKYATSFIVHDKSEFTLKEMVQREENGTVQVAKENNPKEVCKAYLWMEGSEVHFWSDADTVYMPPDSSGLFYGSTIVESLDLSRFSFAKVTTALNMFYEMKNIDNIIFPSVVDLRNAASMENMFKNSSIKSADLSQFLTSDNLKNVSRMFDICKNLEKITLGSEFDTSGVTNFYCMFAASPNLTEVNANILNTQSGTNMEGIFAESSSLKSVDISTWDFSNATNVSRLFDRCTNLQSVKFPEESDMTNVTSMKQMFYQSGITAVNLSSFKTSGNLTNVSEMFYKCYSLEKVDFGNEFDTSGVTSFKNLFNSCNALTEVNTEVLRTQSVTDMTDLFNNCCNLKSIDISTWKFDNVTSMELMFYKTYNMSSVSFPQKVNAVNVKSMKQMFNESGIVNADLNGFVTSNKLNNMERMFNKCLNLTEIKFGDKFDTSGVTTFNYLFAESKNFESVDISTWNISNNANVNEFFNRCNSLQNAYVSQKFYDLYSKAPNHANLDKCIVQ